MEVILILGVRLGDIDRNLAGNKIEELINKSTGRNFTFSKYSHIFNLGNDTIAFYNALNLEVVYVLRDKLLIPAFIHELYRTGILVQDQQHDELLLTGLLDNIPDPKYSLLRILVSDICNLSCKYCKVIQNITTARSRPISNENIDSALKVFAKLGEENGPKLVQITGGEPLLFRDTVEYITESAHSILKNNFWIDVFTNGTIMDKGMADYFRNKNIKVIVSIDLAREAHDRCRLYNHNPEKGTFQQALNTYRLLKEAGCEVGISAVIGSHNIEDLTFSLKEFVDEFRPSSVGLNILKHPSYFNKNGDSLLISPVDYSNRVYEAFKGIREYSDVFIEQLHRRLKPFIEKQFKYFDCGIAGNNININSRGNTGPCKSFLVMEKIYLESPSRLNAAEGKELFEQFMKRSTLKNEECLRCHAIGICGMGCAYEALIETGDMFDFSRRECEHVKNYLFLFIKDLYEQINKENSILNKQGWHTPTPDDRRKLWKHLRIQEGSLKYPVGHY